MDTLDATSCFLTLIAQTSEWKHTTPDREETGGANSQSLMKRFLTGISRTLTQCSQMGMARTSWESSYTYGRTLPLRSSHQSHMSRNDPLHGQESQAHSHPASSNKPHQVFPIFHVAAPRRHTGENHRKSIQTQHRENMRQTRQQVGHCTTTHMTNYVNLVTSAKRNVTCTGSFLLAQRKPSGNHLTRDEHNRGEK